jgi:DNA-binding transcriptional LysR family regulator
LSLNKKPCRITYMIDLRRLRVLRAVDHHGTVTAAAAALHFTPSAASQQIRQLARELGVDLLEPHGRRVRLTPAAHRLLKHAEAIQSRWEQAEIDLQADDQPTGVLRVCGFPVAISTLLAPLAAALKPKHPTLQVRIREAESTESFDLLMDEDVDLAVIEATPDNPPRGNPRFDQRPLLDDPFDLAVPTTHPLATRTAITLDEAAAEDWIMPLSACTCRTHVLAACSAAGFTPNVAHHALSWSATAALVANDLGVALVPRLARLPPHLPITRVHCQDGPSRKVLTCTRPSGRQHPAVATALRALGELAVS